MRPLVWLVVAATLVAVPRVGSGQQRLTARAVVDRIKQNIGVPWAEQTVDTFKDGDAETPVTGIAVTMMATLDVRASGHGGVRALAPHDRHRRARHARPGG